MLGHEPLELPHERRVPALLQVLLDPPLEAGEAELLQARDLALREALVGELGERLPPPEGKRLSRLVLGQTLEASEVELVLCHPQAVAGRPRLQALLAERLAQPGDVHLQRLLGRLRRLVLPQGLDQAVTRDDLVRVQKQNGEQGALLAAVEIDLSPVLRHLERAEDPELHVPLLSSPDGWPR
jgi:hypothetical protein